MNAEEWTVVVGASRAEVWAALTDPRAMAEWMGEPGMNLQVDADWTLGGHIVIRGLLHEDFENRGTISGFEPQAWLRYSHLSSISRLPDVPESYSEFEFRLADAPGGTAVTISVRGFPDEIIRRHLVLYWGGTAGVLKRHVEARRSR